MTEQWQRQVLEEFIEHCSVIEQCEKPVSFLPELIG